MPMTARFVKTAPAGKHYDGGGLFLRVKPSGARTWVWRGTIRGTGGRRVDRGLGPYPVVTLAEARAAALACRRAAFRGVDPRSAEASHHTHLPRGSGGDNHRALAGLA